MFFSKGFALLGLVISLIPFNAESQGFFLQPGQSVTLNFNNFVGSGFETLQFTRLFTNPGFSTAGGAVLEAFENNNSEVPIATTPFGIGDFLIPLPVGAWNDLQGVVRVTAGTSPVELNTIRAVVVLSDHSRYDQVVTVVPEPNLVCVFLAAGTGMLLFRRIRYEV